MASQLLPRCATLADTRTGFGPRGLILLLASLVVLALVWAGWAQVEQVVRATGKVEPADQVQVVNHRSGGRVAGVAVREGAFVSQGDVLLHLDDELDRSALTELQGRLDAERARVARLEAELLERGLQVPATLAQLRPELVAEEAALLAARTTAHERQLAQLVSTEHRRAIEVEEQAHAVQRLERTLAILKQEAAATAELTARGLSPRLRQLGVDRQVADAEGELEVAKSSRDAAAAAQIEAQDAQARLVADRERDLRLELAASRAEVFNLEQALHRQGQVVHELVVRAPVTGIVKDLVVNTPGQSFAPHTPLVTIVPTEGPLLVEARVAHSDIGKLHVGQEAVVKVMAFDYLRYGRLEGRIIHIAADATTDERTGEVTYRVRVETDRPELERDGVTYPLVPGMLVDVELITGERSILSFLTDRILMLRDDAFREG
ncbi:MAG: HlyD family type I secretion periplasmic adaptor subunit [Geminicoccaceae bacterium]|nr:MAG: HlyD family type I secretion periplasmic adaptor subunit [Geminicoccaceae bacterium]